MKKLLSIFFLLITFLSYASDELFFSFKDPQQTERFHKVLIEKGIQQFKSNPDWVSLPILPLEAGIVVDCIFDEKLQNEIIIKIETTLQIVFNAPQKETVRLYLKGQVLYAIDTLPNAK